MPVSIRPARLSDAPAWARVNVDTWHSAYRGIVPEEMLARQTYAGAEKLFRDGMTGDGAGAVHFVAVSGEEVVGIAAAGPNRRKDLPYGGELWAIYVLREHQRGGIGRRLLGAAGRALLAAGYGSMIVQVLTENPSRKFYESLGGVPQEGEFMFEAPGVALAEAIYVWPDLATLARRIPEES